MPASTADPAPFVPAASRMRAFGRYALHRLVGKSEATMVWLAADPSGGDDVLLCLPRLRPADAAAAARWEGDVRRAARLQHPQLAPVREVGVQDHWPFIVVPARQRTPLVDWLAEHPQPAPEQAAQWCGELLQGLAFAHEAGSVHGDLQLHHVLIDDRGGASVMALAVAGDGPNPLHGTAAALPSHERTLALDPKQLQAQRAGAARDVLGVGLLLYRLLAGRAALDVADLAEAAARMAPAGREFVRLPWSTPLPLPQALRTIADRATADQERLRYRSARSFAAALDGWRQAHGDDDRGPVGRLLDRLASVGHLPALPGASARVARLTTSEGRRTDEMAAEVLHDLGLSFELLRTLHSAQVQGTQTAGDGPELTLRRVIALIGVNGVRLAANTLRAWPGPLDAGGAAALQAALDRARLAGHTAAALRPPGYDAQVVYLVATLQNLGRLLLRYHFADEAEQIEQLTRPAPAPPPLEPKEQPGMTEEQAAVAVLGVDVETLALAAARQWRLGDAVLQMLRRVPADAPVRKPAGDADLIRVIASAANDAVDAAGRAPVARAGAALAQVGRRYARALGIDGRELIDALQAGKEALRAAAAPPPAATPLGAAAPAAAAGQGRDLPSAPGADAADADVPAAPAPPRLHDRAPADPGDA